LAGLHLADVENARAVPGEQALVHSDLAHFPAAGEIVIFDRSDEAPIEDRRSIQEKF